MAIGSVLSAPIAASLHAKLSRGDHISLISTRWTLQQQVPHPVRILRAADLPYAAARLTAPELVG